MVSNEMSSVVWPTHPTVETQTWTAVAVPGCAVPNWTVLYLLVFEKPLDMHYPPAWERWVESRRVEWMRAIAGFVVAFLMLLSLGFWHTLLSEWSVILSYQLHRCKLDFKCLVALEPGFYLCPVEHWQYFNFNFFGKGLVCHISAMIWFYFRTNECVI